MMLHNSLKPTPQEKYVVDIKLSALITRSLHIVSMHFCYVSGRAFKRAVSTSCHTTYIHTTYYIHTSCLILHRIIKSGLIYCLFQNVLRISLYCLICYSALTSSLFKTDSIWGSGETQLHHITTESC